MAKQESALPYKEIGQLANRETLRKLATKRGRETYYIPFSKVEVRDGFNTRTQDDFDDIPELAKMIMANGLEPLHVDITADAKAIIDEGHRRHAALTYIAKNEAKWFKTANIKGILKGSVECFINGKDVTEIERIKGILSSNYVRPLSYKSKVHTVTRLKQPPFEMTNQAIADAIGMSRQAVDNMLILASQSETMHQLIEEKLITPTVAVALVRKVKDPDDLDRVIFTAAANKTEITTAYVKVLGEDGYPTPQTTTVSKLNAVDEDAPFGDNWKPVEVPTGSVLHNDHSASFNDELDDELDSAADAFKMAASGQVKEIEEDDTQELKSHTTSSKAPRQEDRIKHDKLNEMKDEEVMLVDVVKDLDKINNICGKGLNDQAAHDVDTMVRFMQQKLSSIRLFIQKAEIR